MPDSVRHAIAHNLLASVRLTGLLDRDGRPTEGSWDRLGVLSSGEFVVVALAFAIVGYTVHPWPGINRLALLDRKRLLAASEALRELAGELL